MKSLIIKILMTALMLNSQAYAQMSTCDITKLMENELVELNRERNSKRMLQEQYLQAKRIQEQLADPEKTKDVIMLAQRFEDEIQGLEDRQDLQYAGAGVSIGSIILSGYFIKKMSQSTRGMAMWDRFKHQVKLTPGKTLINSVFFLSTLSSLWVVYNIKATQTKIEMLAEVIDKLNRLGDLSAEIERLTDEITEIRASYDLMVDDIVFQELGSVGQDGLLYCD